MVNYSRALPVDSSKVQNHHHLIHPFDVQIHFVLKEKKFKLGVSQSYNPPPKLIKYLLTREKPYYTEQVSLGFERIKMRMNAEQHSSVKMSPSTQSKLI